MTRLRSTQLNLGVSSLHQFCMAYRLHTNN